MLSLAMELAFLPVKQTIRGYTTYVLGSSLAYRQWGHPRQIAAVANTSKWQQATSNLCAAGGIILPNSTKAREHRHHPDQPHQETHLVCIATCMMPTKQVQNSIHADSTASRHGRRHVSGCSVFCPGKAAAAEKSDEDIFLLRVYLPLTFGVGGCSIHPSSMTTATRSYWGFQKQIPKVSLSLSLGLGELTSQPGGILKRVLSFCASIVCFESSREAGQQNKTSACSFRKRVHAVISLLFSHGIPPRITALFWILPSPTA